LKWNFLNGSSHILSSSFSHGSQTYFNIRMKLHCLVDTTNFIKILNHSNHFLNTFLFLVYSNIFFWHNYIITSHHMKFKNVNFLAFDFFGFWPTIICKNIMNFFIIKTWLTFKHGTSEKTIQCDNNIGPH